MLNKDISSQKIFRTLRRSIVCLAILGTAPFEAAAIDSSRLYSMEGIVEVLASPSDGWKPAALNMILDSGSAIRTGDASRAAIVGTDGMMIRLNANSMMEFGKDRNGEKTEINFKQGDAHFLSRDPHAEENVTTSIVSGAIRGTEFAVSASKNKVTFTVMNGSVECSNSFGSTQLSSGEAAVTTPGSAPKKEITVKPYDAVQWAIRYPLVLSRYAFREQSSQNDATRKVIEGYFDAASQGDFETARKVITAYKGSDNATLNLIKSSLALAAGQIEEAAKYQTAVAHVAQVEPAQVTLVESQMAIVAIANNERERASKLVTSAITRSPDSPDALLAQSLLAQSNGDITSARAAIKKALQIEPENSSLLSRAAELAFGAGETKQAEELIARARVASPTNSQVLTTAGFIVMSRGKEAEAEELFDHALLRDGSDPSAHLGLGITLISKGELEAGRLEIQKAVHLDPANSLFRSYLGKAFFESNKEGLANEELNQAARLDPLDPTPHLYQAFNNLALYKPVAALNSIEAAIERNSNRAVYRSRLLLDQDEAIRSVGLGRIFAALDFTAPARVEALKTLSEDPANYSGHLLLKDSLIDPATNSAAIAEEVTAGLLAPASFSGLLPTASGAATLNDYTSLFERDQSRFAVDLIAQSKERLLDTSEVYFAGGDDYSYLLRHGSTYSNGYRNNDYQRLQTGRVLTQYDVTPDDKILLEGIISSNGLGDNGIGLDPHSNDPDFEGDFDDLTLRAGYHHTWDASSHLIGQAFFVNSRSRFVDHSRERLFSIIDDLVPVSPLKDEGVFDLNYRSRTKGVRGDVQHIYNTEYASIVTGTSITTFHEYNAELGTASGDALGYFDSLDLSSESDPSPRTYRAYSYITGKPARSLRLVAGAEYAHASNPLSDTLPYFNGELSKTSWNPKVGVIAYPGGNISLRTAYFETLGNGSVRDLEGIQPSQVAGIEQLFDDLPGTRSRNWGSGIDWKSPGSTYIGGEYLHRAIASTLGSSESVITIDELGNLGDFVDSSLYTDRSFEHVVTGYLNQVLTETLVGTIDYDWTLSDFETSTYETRTHRVRAGLNYFDRSGFFAFGSATWRYQDRDNFDLANETAKSDFWIASAGLGWQLPHRHGSIQFVARNIFQQDFTYLPTGHDLTFYPGTDFSLSFSINF